MNKVRSKYHSKILNQITKLKIAKINTPNIKDFATIDLTDMENNLKESKINSIIQDYLDSFPYVQLNGNYFTEVQRDKIFVKYYTKILGFTDVEAIHYMKEFKAQFLIDIRKNKISSKYKTEYLLPLEMVCDNKFDLLCQKRSKSFCIENPYIQFISESIVKIDEYKNVHFACKIDLNSILQLKINNEKMKEKISEYLIQIDAILAFIVKNFKTQRGGIDPSLNYLDDYYQKKDLDLTYRQSYALIINLLKSIKNLANMGLIDQNQEEFQKILENSFNTKYFDATVIVNGESMSFWNAICNNWEYLSTFYARYDTKNNYEQTEFFKAIFGTLETSKVEAGISIRRAKSFQNQIFRGYVNKIKKFKDLTEFGIITDILPSSRYEFGSENKYSVGRIARLINFFSNWININSSNTCDFNDVFPLNSYNRASRLSKLKSGEDQPNQEEVEWFEKIIQYFIDILFEGENFNQKILQFNQFLNSQYSQYFSNNSKLDYANIKYVPFDIWAKNNLKVTGYAFNTFTFTVLNNDQPVTVKVRSQFERYVIEKLVSLRIIDKLITPQNFDQMKARNLRMLLKYNGLEIDGKVSIGDIGITLSLDNFRSVIIECLGAGENMHARIYGEEKDLACKASIVEGFGLLYICYPSKEKADYYLYHATYIGKIAPFLTKNQFDVLINYMVIHHTGLEQSLFELSTKCCPEDRIISLEIQEAFGLIPTCLTRENLINKEIQNASIYPEFQDWWFNWHQSNHPFIGGHENWHYQQSSFNPSNQYPTY